MYVVVCMCVCGMVWSCSGMALDHGLSFSGVSSCCQEGGGFGPQVKQNAMLWAGVFFWGGSASGNALTDPNFAAGDS